MDNEKKEQAECKRCEGTGKEHNNIARTIDECPYCDGRGYITTPSPQSEQKQEGETVEDILTTEFYKKMRRAFDMYKSVRHRLHYMKEVTGFDSQNIMKYLTGLGVDGTLAVRIHKLMFHAEWLEQSQVFEWIEKRRVDLVCAQSRQSQHTAKQIEENAYGWISKLNEKQIQIQGKDKQIDQYKARIVALEAEKETTRDELLRLKGIDNTCEKGLL